MVDETAPELDLAIVGAGFAGLYMLHRARMMGLRVRVFEAARRCWRHMVVEYLPRCALRH